MPAVSTDLLIYAFAGVSFGRGNYNYGDTEWPAREAIRQIDDVLDSSTPYRDFGGTKIQPFSFTAAFDSRAARDSLVNKVGSTATLTKTTTGQSITVMLATATPIALASGLPGATISFE